MKSEGCSKRYEMKYKTQFHKNCMVIFIICYLMFREISKQSMSKVSGLYIICIQGSLHNKQENFHLGTQRFFTSYNCTNCAVVTYSTGGWSPACLLNSPKLHSMKLWSEPQLCNLIMYSSQKLSLRQQNMTSWF